MEKGPNEEYRLEMGGTLLGTFSQKKLALTEYNRLRQEFEIKCPPTEWTDQEKRQLLMQSISDGLLRHNSLRTPRKKAAKSRTFG